MSTCFMRSWNILLIKRRNKSRKRSPPTLSPWRRCFFFSAPVSSFSFLSPSDFLFISFFLFFIKKNTILQSTYTWGCYFVFTKCFHNHHPRIAPTAHHTRMLCHFPNKFIKDSSLHLRLCLPSSFSFSLSLITNFGRSQLPHEQPYGEAQVVRN